MYNSGVPTLAEISYATALRELDLQERGLAELRQRTGILVGASSLTASFLGAQAIQHATEIGVLGGLALVSLAASVGLSTYVLPPKEGFVFGVDAVVQYEALFAVQDDEQEVQRRLAYWLNGFWSPNQKKIDDLSQYFLGAAIALVLQLLFWTLALASNLG